MRNYLLIFFASFAAIVANGTHALADDPRPVLDWERKNTPGTTLGALSQDIFGESIDPHLGGVSFSVVDVSIPGNFDIPVEIRRTITQGQNYHPSETAAFGDWELDIPRISFDYMGDAPANNICSGKLKDVFKRSSVATNAGGSWNISRLEPEDYGAGFRLKMNGDSQEFLDRRYSGGTDGDFFPSAAKFGTKNYWYFTCIQSDQNFEGFLGHSPDGKTYRFDHVITKRKTNPLPDSVSTFPANGFIDPKAIITNVSLMVTKIKDQFGNEVNYSYYAPGWASNRPESPLYKIEASDGRAIQIAYRQQSAPQFEKNHHQISQVNVGGTRSGSSFIGGRTWKYSYRISDYEFAFWEVDKNAFWDSWEPRSFWPWPTLAKVTQPDNKKWIYQLDNMIAVGSPSEICARKDEVYDLNVTHPEGAKLSLKLQQKHHRVSRHKDLSAYSYCTSPLVWTGNGMSGVEVDDVTFTSKMSVIEKTVDVNQQQSKWTYEYEQDKRDNSPDFRNQTNTTTITGPDSRIKYEHFWLRLHENNPNADGKTAQIEIFDKTGNTLFERRTFEWSRERTIGFSFGDRNFDDRYIYATPFNLTKLVVEKHDNGGVDTTTTTNTHNTNHGAANYSFGLPVKISVQSSISNETRNSETLYEHKASPWILGLTKQVKVNGREESEYSFDIYGLKRTETRFNAPYATYAYHMGVGSDYRGALHIVKDPLNNSTSFEEYKRGTATKVTNAEGRVSSLGIDDNGWVTSKTDAKGNLTSYQHDAMGRITKITYPKIPGLVRTNPVICKPGLYCPPPTEEQSFSDYWLDTNINLNNVSAIYPDTGFIQNITTGSEKKVISYDNLLRPILERANDSINGWNSYVKTTYDEAGRIKFKSFPSSNPNPVNGTDFTYDALGRELTRKENVAPFAETRTEYLSSNRTRVTDAAGKQTTQHKNGFGELIQIEQPMGVNTYLHRNQWGELERLQQSGFSDGYSVNQTHTYVYNSRRQLCRYHTPSGGSTLYEYDGAWRVESYSKGHPYSNSCATPSGDSKVTMTYDPLGRPKVTNYSDSNTPDISRKFDENGNLTELLRGNVKWKYGYDTLNNLTGEQLDVDGRTFSLSYKFNQNNHLESRTLPGSQLIEFAPDGLGRPTKAARGSYPYATSIDYYFDGSVKDMRYGNDQAYSRELTPRLQTKRLYSVKGSTKAVDLNYTYDERGLVKTMNSHAVSGDNRVYNYDDLGRLTSSSGPWGNSSYKYDALGNIRQRRLTLRTFDMQYSPDNRLNAYIETGVSMPWQPGTRSPLEYDNRGNVTKLRDLNFVYDMADQPREISGSVYSENVSGIYTYDGNMRRVKAEVNGDTIYNVYDKSGALVYIDKITPEETISTYYISAAGMTIARVVSTEAVTTDGTSGSTNQPSSPTLLFEGGFDGIGNNLGWVNDIDDNSATAAIPVTTFLHPDHLGSAQTGTDQSGNISWRTQYMPYGSTMSSPSDNEDQAGFTGHIKDSATGLNYMQARYYDPLIGRFLSVDPVTFMDSGNPGYFNRYVYTHNNPINGTDPTGMACDGCIDSASLRRDGFTDAQISTFRNHMAFDSREFWMTLSSHNAETGSEFAVGLAKEIGIGYFWEGPAGMEFSGATRVGVSSFQGLKSAAYSSAKSRELYKVYNSVIDETVVRQFNREMPDGLANAVLLERKYGVLSGGKSHLKKGQDALRWTSKQRKKISNSSYLKDRHKEKLIKRLDSFSDPLQHAFSQ